MNDKENYVSLKNAGVFRSGKWLVRGIDLSIKKGEIVTLIGPNGSGKSTTAKLALGLLKPNEGNSFKKFGLKTRYVPQQLSIDWTLPLKVRRFMSLTGPTSSKDAERAMTLTRILHLKNSEVRTLSGGEFQRVLLARAIASNPEFLVLDEPVRGVDFSGEIEIYDLIKQIRNELYCGILMISHDLHIVMAATDQVICLNGHICCSGTPKKVVSSREYKELFGDRAIPELALYKHQHDHYHSPDGKVLYQSNTISDHSHSKNTKTQKFTKTKIKNKKD